MFPIQGRSIHLEYQLFYFTYLNAERIVVQSGRTESVQRKTAASSSDAAIYRKPSELEWDWDLIVMNAQNSM